MNARAAGRHHKHRKIHGVALYVRVETKRHFWLWDYWHWSWRRYVLNPKRKVNIMVDVVVGHTIVNTIVYLDANGAPMLSNPVPDSPPVWTNVADPSIDTMTVSADGSTDTVQAVGVGVDTLSVSVTVGGVAFTASAQINVSGAPQVLGSVAIESTVQ